VALQKRWGFCLNEDMKFKNWLFADKQGKIVTWQIPNWPILTWMVLFVSAKFMTGNTADAVFKLSYIFLAWWAILELTSGVNRFRRIMGLTAIIYIASKLFV
jgi:hypothetical protein